MHIKRSGLAVVFGLASLASVASSAPAISAPPAPASRQAASSVEEDPLYQTGLSLYAAGNPVQALDSFRAALRRNANDPLAQSAVSRLEAELYGSHSALVTFDEAPAEPTMIAKASAEFDQLVLVHIPHAMNFNDTLGNGLASIGTLSALNGRVIQLLKEKQVALRHSRPFRKEGELLGLVRRMPAVAAEPVAAAAPDARLFGASS
jgi:hypothetical protein